MPKRIALTLLPHGLALTAINLLSLACADTIEISRRPIDAIRHDDLAILRVLSSDELILVPGSGWVKRKLPIGDVVLEGAPNPKSGALALASMSRLTIVDRRGTVIASRSGLESITHIQWSRDGERIAFQSVAPNGRPGIFVVNANDLRDVVFLEGASFPSWSNKSHYLMYIADSTVRIIDLDTSTSQAVIDATWASWSPDGRTMLVRSRTGRVACMDVRTRRVEESIERPIQFGPVWSENGKFWLFVERDNSLRALFNVACPEPKRLIVREIATHAETYIERICKSPTVVRFDWIYLSRFQ